MTLYIPNVRLRRDISIPVGLLIDNRWFTPELRHLSKCIHTLRKSFQTPGPPRTNNESCLCRSIWKNDLRKYSRYPEPKPVTLTRKFGVIRQSFIYTDPSLLEELRNKIIITKSSHKANLIHSFAGKSNKIYDYIRGYLSSNDSILSQVEFNKFNKSVATSDIDRASLFTRFSLS
jgi:hypothetical protein